MKLNVLPKETFDAWVLGGREESGLGFGVLSRRPDIRKLRSLTAEVMPREIEVSPTTRIGAVIRLIVGEEPLTHVMQHWNLYCLQASSDSLEHAKPLNAYDIQDGDILLLERKIIVPLDRINIGYSALPVRDVFEFCRRIKGAENIAQALNPGGGLAEISLKNLDLKGVLLYTEADFELSKHVRYNFFELDKMIGDYLELYFIEQPTLLNGIAAHEYWKAYLEESAYSILHALGFTKNKPYNKSDAYEIANMISVLPECLPCLVIFNDLKSSEKIVITLIDNYTLFFRKLSSILTTVREIMMKRRDLVDKRIKEKSKGFMGEVKKSFRIIDVSPCNSIEDPMERIKARGELYRQMRNAGALTKSESEKKAREIYECTPEYEEDQHEIHIINSFGFFKQEFLREWKSRDKQRQPTSSFTFQGDTVFINKPETPYVQEIIMGDKFNVRTGDISNASSNVFIGKFDNIFQNLRESSQQDMADALKTLKEGILSSPHIPMDKKEEHMEVIIKIGEEAAKNKPNRTLLKIMSDGLLSSLKIVPDLAKAVEALTPLFR